MDGSRQCSVLTIAVSDYDDRSLDRPILRDVADRFSGLFAAHEQVVLNDRLSGAVVEGTAHDRIRVWGATGSGSHVGVLLWTGHGESGRLKTSDDSIAAATIADWIAGGPKGFRFDRWLIVIDACWAASIARPVRDALEQRARSPNKAVFVLASADATDPADAGVFTQVLVDVLEQGVERGWWGHQDEYVEADEVNKRVDELIEERLGFTAVPFLGGSRRPGRIFPNPRYRPTSIDVPLDEAHFLPKARGIEATETGWYFTGRVHALSRIVSWLDNDEPTGDMFIVTGSAGTGKSALVGRIVTLSVPSYRDLVPADVLGDAAAGTVPRLGVITAAFHARERRVDELLRFVGDMLGAAGVREVNELTYIVRAKPAPVTLVVDALDEAARGHGRRMVDEVLAPLVRAGARVLIGSRPGVVEWAERGVRTENVVDLDAEPNTVDDIARYVASRLLRLDRSPYLNAPALAERIARGIAEKSVSADPATGQVIPNFLVARIVSRQVASIGTAIDPRPGWEADLPNGFDEAFQTDLDSYRARLGQELAERIEALLEALAWDEGTGIPRRHLPAIALAVTGVTVTVDDVSELIREAAGHITESSADGYSQYRLYHERLREHLRNRTRRRQGPQ